LGDRGLVRLLERHLVVARAGERKNLIRRVNIKPNVEMFRNKARWSGWVVAPSRGPPASISGANLGRHQWTVGRGSWL
jgi:hypothetical protein